MEIIKTFSSTVLTACTASCCVVCDESTATQWNAHERDKRSWEMTVPFRIVSRWLAQHLAVRCVAKEQRQPAETRKYPTRHTGCVETQAEDGLELCKMGSLEFNEAWECLELDLHWILRMLITWESNFDYLDIWQDLKPLQIADRWALKPVLSISDESCRGWSPQCRTRNKELASLKIEGKYSNVCDSDFQRTVHMQTTWTWWPGHIMSFGKIEDVGIGCAQMRRVCDDIEDLGIRCAQRSLRSYCIVDCGNTEDLDVWWISSLKKQMRFENIDDHDAEWAWKKFITMAHQVNVPRRSLLPWRRVSCGKC